MSTPKGYTVTNMPAEFTDCAVSPAAPTLPAMTDHEIVKTCHPIDWPVLRADCRQDTLEYARAIIAARDAQWAARLDAAVRDEREACANLCELISGDYKEAQRQSDSYISDYCAVAIRARTKD